MQPQYSVTPLVKSSARLLPAANCRLATVEFRVGARTVLAVTPVLRLTAADKRSEPPPMAVPLGTFSSIRVVLELVLSRADC